MWCCGFFASFMRFFLCVLVCLCVFNVVVLVWVFLCVDFFPRGVFVVIFVSVGGWLGVFLFP